MTKILCPKCGEKIHFHLSLNRVIPLTCPRCEWRVEIRIHKPKRWPK